MRAARRSAPNIELEVNRRSVLGASRSLEIGTSTEAGEQSEDVRREAFDRRVIRADFVVEAGAFDANAVLRTFKLRHEIADVATRSEGRIVLNDRDEAAERGFHLAGGGGFGIG